MHHQGLALKAIVDWINQQNFQNGLIDISDTLNRHNHMISGISEIESYEISKREGLKWELQNKDVLAELKMPVQIVHWDHWLQDERYPIYLRAFEKALEKDLHLKMGMMSDIERHYQRKYKQTLHERSSSDVALSQKYYLEELAVLTIQFEDFPCAEFYPGKELDCVRAVRSGNVKNVPMGLLNAVHVPMFLHEEEQKQTA